MNTTLFSAKSLLHLQKATELMHEIMATDDAYLHRSKMRQIESQLASAGIAPGKFLSDYFQKIYASSEAPAQPSKAEGKKPLGNTINTVPSATHTHQCRGCGLHFSPKAFNGHGERRCLIKHGKEVPHE